MSEGQRWEQGEDCTVVDAETGCCIAVMGNAFERATDADWRNLPIVIAAPTMLALIRAHREQFAFYADEHRAKGALGAEKAAVNQRLVDGCDAVIARALNEAGSQVIR
jgi:hypothetical protein